MIPSVRTHTENETKDIIDIPKRNSSTEAGERKARSKKRSRVKNPVKGLKRPNKSKSIGRKEQGKQPVVDDATRLGEYDVTINTVAAGLINDPTTESQKNSGSNVPVATHAPSVKVKKRLEADLARTQACLEQTEADETKSMLGRIEDIFHSRTQQGEVAAQLPISA